MNNIFMIKGRHRFPFNSNFVRLKLLLLCILLTAISCLALPASQAFSQQPASVVVTGAVSSADGEPLAGVSVGVKGKSTGVVTNLQGQYRITVPENGVLIVNYIGFKQQEINVNKRTQINIVLSPEITRLDEIVVVGYGTLQKSDCKSSAKSGHDILKT